MGMKTSEDVILPSFCIDLLPSFLNRALPLPFSSFPLSKHVNSVLTLSITPQHHHSGTSLLILCVCVCVQIIVNILI